MSAMIKLITHTKFREDHIKLLIKTLFWIFYNALHKEKLECDQCKKFDETVRKIICQFKFPGRKFKLANKTVNLTSNDIRLIFGVSDGHIPIS